MAKRILLLFVAALLAWHLGPLLTQLSIVVAFIATILGTMTSPEEILHKPAEFWIQFAIWLIVFWFALPGMLSFVSFMVPSAHRYSGTKRMRRIQGILAEVIVLVSFFLIAIGVLMWLPFNKNGLAEEILREPEIAQANQNLYEYVKEYSDKMSDAAGMFDAPVRGWDKEPRWLFHTYFVGMQNLSVEKGWTGDVDGIYSKSLEKFYRTITTEEERKDVIFDHLDEVSFLRDRGVYPPPPDARVTVIFNEKTSAREKWNELIRNPYTSVSQFYWESAIRRPMIPLIVAMIGYIFWFSSKADFGITYSSIIRFWEQGRFGLGGSGRFASLFEEWTLQYGGMNHGLYLGRSLYQPWVTIGLKDKRHMLTIAGSRSGKGATAIIPNLLRWEGSALVIDPKGTNAAVTARARRAMGHDVHVVDPFNITGNNETASFNPLAELDPDGPAVREQIMVIADALVVGDPGTREKHWDDGARTVIGGLIAHLICQDSKDNTPWLGNLRDWMTKDFEDQAELWVDMRYNTRAGGLARDAAARVMRGIKTNEILGILSNADKHTDWLGSEAIASAMRTSSFKFADLKQRPTTVYLVLPPEFLETHNRFLRLFVNMAINSMSVGGRSKTPVLLMLDEFLSLGRMEQVERAFGLMAGYNLTIWPFVQDFGRLKDLYQASVNAFITNSRAVQIFGVFDQETCEFVSKHLGNRVPATLLGTSANRLGVPLRDPSEVARDVEAGSGRQYILRAGMSPLLIEKVSYYDRGLIGAIRNAVRNKLPPWLQDDFDKSNWRVGQHDPDPDYKR